MNDDVLTTFEESFSEMFLSRISDSDTFEQLHSLATYRDAKSKYDEAYEAVAQNCPQALEELMRTIHRIQDLEQEYLYRMGFQEGLRLQNVSFLTEGLK